MSGVRIVLKEDEIRLQRNTSLVTQSTSDWHLIALIRIDYVNYICLFANNVLVNIPMYK